ncbi:axonemal dynein light chain domain-containing protein 1 isoform X3 [Hydra vulgaris]|uniref:Axonemal dynein light chain domain-containing protein 1 isoform X3 n=2 Tax=Hydra vulgaris TaxID=6087 RepID=A0ABM4BEZ3_HYDVU
MVATDTHLKKNYMDSILHEDPTSKNSNKRKQTLPPINNDKIFDYLPESILATLTHRNKKYENLGPINKTYKAKVDNVWNHEKSRAKIKHLIEQPFCICGAGKDISFLVDANTIDHFRSSNSNGLNINEATDTIIPKEFHVVKHKGTLGLEILEDKYTAQVKNHEEHLMIFPSMNPAGRQEAAQLLKTMNEMLKKAGIFERHEVLGADGEEADSKIESLLKLVQDEQKIYNIVFNEIIRQVSVDCLERGKILAELRKHYASLLYKVPIHIKNLHDEILAIRALDKRLTEELINFKSTIKHLTNELHDVQLHDQEITCKAMETKEELDEVLKDSQADASRLLDYHELYELQRHRMENQLSKLIDERNLWTETAFMLSLKVIEKHKMMTLHRLHLFEELWHNIISQAVKTLLQKDEQQMELIKNNVNDWLRVGNLFDERLSQAEVNSYLDIKEVFLEIKDWASKFQTQQEKGFQHLLNGINIKELLSRLKSWEKHFLNEADRFSDAILLCNEDDLLKMTSCLDLCWENSAQVFHRHFLKNKQHPQHTIMIELKKKIKALHNHLSIRMCGENGLTKSINSLTYTMNKWINKINGVIDGQLLFDSEWIQFAGHLQQQWLDSISNILSILSTSINNLKFDANTLESSPQTCDIVLSEKKKSKSQFMLVSEELQIWLNNTVESINEENNKTLEQVSLTHLSMIRWAIIFLLRMTPDVESRNASKVTVADVKSVISLSILDECSSQAIVKQANTIFKNLASLCELVNEALKNDSALFSSEDLKKIEIESQGWIQTASLLAKELSDEFVQVDTFTQGQTSLIAYKKIEKKQFSSKTNPQEDVFVTVSEDLHSNQIIDVSVDDLDPSDNLSPKVNIISDNEILIRKSVNSFNKVLKTAFKEGPVLNNDELNSLQHLQSQLISTEERAQMAEERALAAELSLKISDEKIKALERNGMKLSKHLLTKN